MKDTLDREVSLENAITGDKYLMKPLYTVESSSANLDTVSAICNEELVYEWCFREMCDGNPYPRELAKDWLNWGTQGWANQSHFVYAVVDRSGAVAAACDIKSSNRERAEIGYWSSERHRGIMTNAVRGVVQIADEAGFEVLFADIHPENDRSLAVIRRCGFSEVDRLPTIEGHTPFDRISPVTDAS